MRKVPVAEAVGLELGHDITEIRPEAGVKRRALRRGHRVTAADVARLRDLGKSAVFVCDDAADEVHEGRIKDAFIPNLTARLEAYGVAVAAAEILPDDRARIAARVAALADRCGLVLVTGGTSVDPDDVTVGAMTDAGVDCAVCGMPVQPGNNFTIGYRGETAVCAVPAAALVHRATALDLFLPRLLAGERIDREQAAAMGLGGLAPPSADDHFPDSAFGRGGCA